MPETWDRSGLPGWAYHSPAFLALEKAELFATHWQIVCHVCDLPEPGAWVALDIGDDRALVIRGQDGTIRAVHNLCRHRGARVAAGDAGPVPERPRLPVPRLGLQPRRHPARPGAAAHLRERPRPHRSTA